MSARRAGGGNIAGRVTDAANKPVKGAQVTATDQAGQASPPAATDGNGDYEIDNLAPGNYTVQVQPPAGIPAPPAMPNVAVAAGQVARGTDFQLPAAAPPAGTGIISGRVTDAANNPVPGAQVTATDQAGQPSPPAATDGNGDYKIDNLAPGNYTVQIQPPGGIPAPPAMPNVAVAAGQVARGTDFQLPAAAPPAAPTFATLLSDPEFDIETPINQVEAEWAARLFRVVTMLMAGRTNASTNGQGEPRDALSVLRLNFHWEDEDLARQLQVLDGELGSTLDAGNANARSIRKELNRLAGDLAGGEAQSELDKAFREGRRNFNLGDPSVAGNVRFPEIFNRLVALLNDPLASLDIEEEKGKDRTGIEEINRAYDLLRDIKGLVLQIVRSLSEFGSESLESTVVQWEGFLLSEEDDGAGGSFRVGILQVLKALGDRRHTDTDMKNAWSVLSVLSKRPREPDIASFVGLSRRGGNILDECITLYLAMQNGNKLDAEADVDMQEIFQPPGVADKRKQWFTFRTRPDAALIKRYPVPLPEWQ